jgi:acetyltransferase-like isoleucine patch superfamily enzyme
MVLKIKSSIKKLVSFLLYRPRNLGECGKGSVILRPRNISNRKRIFIGRKSFIHKNSEMLPILVDNDVLYDPKIKIGNNVYIGHDFHVHTMSKIEIGDDCTISDFVYISGASHGFNPIYGNYIKQPLTYSDVVIGNGCFIGRNVFISHGVSLGSC